MTTVQALIDSILTTIPGAPFAETVDTIKSGSGNEEVRGVATTFICTLDVLQKAVDAGCNFIITHEPTYFNHWDKTDWLKDDPVFAAKRAFIQDHGLTIWRFHDYWHTHQPDGINTGFEKAMGWESCRDAEMPNIYNLPPTRLDRLAKEVKEKLGIAHARVVGPAEMTCRRVGTLLGACPGEWHIGMMGGQQVDVVVCGEVSEWQVYEYVRDSNAAGIPHGLIVAGHERSEEPGMEYLVEWLKAREPGLRVVHIPAGDPLQIL